MSVLNLNPTPWRNISVTLRRVADDIDGGKYERVQEAALVLLCGSEENNEQYSTEVFSLGSPGTQQSAYRLLHHGAEQLL